MRRNHFGYVSFLFLTNIKMKQKYNWDKLKVEYLKSDILEITEFFRHKIGKDEVLNSGNLKRQTSGWRDEKEALIKSSFENAKMQFTKRHKDHFDKMLRAKNLLIDLVILRANQSVKTEVIDGVKIQKTDMSVSELYRAYMLLKTELGEPTAPPKREGKEDSNVTVDQLIAALNEQNSQEVDPEWCGSLES